jgi:hypothetical protein
LIPYLSKTWIRSLLPALALAVGAGCGYLGEPLPPLRNIPERVSDVTALQQDGQIQVRFTIPQMTTEGTVLKPPLELDLRIGPGPEPFQQEAWETSAQKVTPVSIRGGIASYQVPCTEWIGKDVIIGERTIGKSGKESLWSNLVALSVVTPPEPPKDLQLANTEQGIRLSWQARGSEFRVFRRSGDGPYEPIARVTQSPWTDDTTDFGQPYSYQVQTLVKAGENQEAESELSAAKSLTPKDEFAPAPPVGLRAVSAPNSIELAWDSSTENDLAGYRVYRALAGGTFQKVADVDIPAYSDMNVEHGKTYRYAVTAVDQAGNESQRSAPAEIRFE